MPQPILPSSSGLLSPHPLSPRHPLPPSPLYSTPLYLSSFPRRFPSCFSRRLPFDFTHSLLTQELPYPLLSCSGLSGGCRLDSGMPAEFPISCTSSVVPANRRDSRFLRIVSDVCRFCHTRFPLSLSVCRETGVLATRQTVAWTASRFCILYVCIRLLSLAWRRVHSPPLQSARVQNSPPNGQATRASIEAGVTSRQTGAGIRCSLLARKRDCQAARVTLSCTQEATGAEEFASRQTDTCTLGSSCRRL